MTEIESKLREELSLKLSKLNDLDVGTDESKAAVAEVSQLMDRDIEYRKLAHEKHEKSEARKEESRLKLIQMRDDRIDKIARHIITLVTFSGTTLAGIALAKATFTYEEKGTISSVLGRKVLSIFIPKP